jgi:tryptophan synthase alpha subunit
MTPSKTFSEKRLKKALNSIRDAQNHQCGKGFGISYSLTEGAVAMSECSGIFEVVGEIYFCIYEIN